MARRYYSSTAVVTALNGGINNSTTSITVDSTTGFPASFPYTLIIDPDTASEEVVEVSSAAGLTLTVVRGRDGTSAVSHTNDAVVKHGVSARDFDEPNAHIDATTGHGATGAVVGTTNTQTLTNKTLTSPVISSISNGGTLTLPTSTDTLVGRATTDTLTNKTLTSPTINGATLDSASTIGGVSGTSLAADRTAWTSYTPSFTGASVSSQYSAYKLIGKTLHVRVYIATGSMTSSTYLSVSLPAGLTAAGSSAVQYTSGIMPSGWTMLVSSGSSVFQSSGTISSGTSLGGFGFNGVIEVA